MIKRVLISGLVVLFLAGYGCSDNPKQDRMKEWGTKKSTAVPMQDFPGGPSDNDQDTHKE